MPGALQPSHPACWPTLPMSARGLPIHAAHGLLCGRALCTNAEGGFRFNTAGLTRHSAHKLGAQYYRRREGTQWVCDIPWGSIAVELLRGTRCTSRGSTVNT